MSARTLLVALLLLPAAASAQDTGWYVGGDVAYSHANFGTDNTATAYGAYAGLFATRAFAFELGYRELGEFGRIKTSALSLAGLWMIPMSERTAAYFKVGVAQTDAEAGPVSDSRTAALVGIGAQVDLARALFGRLSWERYPKSGGSQTGEGAIDVFALGIGVRF
jgi:opacity protein-like surface antigen